MKAILTYLFCSILFFLPSLAFAQGAVADNFFITLGQNYAPNVTYNDNLPSGFPYSVHMSANSSGCFKLDSLGFLHVMPSSDCCGNFELSYTYDSCSFQICSAVINVTVNCKPDCFFINLEDYARSNNPDVPNCAFACERSTATYFIKYDPLNSYSWSVTGGSSVLGDNPAEILVSWGSQGSGAVSLTITDANGIPRILDVCVNILEGPVAGFTPSSTDVCLNSPVHFKNTSTGGSTYFWNFGDSTSSTMPDPTHTYTTPGTYTACLYVTKNNFDPQGNALCCCSDTFCVDIFVDSLERPNIYCISTLCAKDSSKYWTDAMNCGTYYWTVTNEVGLPLPFSGQGANMIFVHWGDGPVGTVTLWVTGCDSLYCKDTASVVVPIISASTVIQGPKEVCEQSSATYSVQKWLSVYYNWQVNGAVSWTGQGTNIIDVQWGSAGAGTISVTYHSDFLSGLPGQDPASCMGTAVPLGVVIKPRFHLFTSLPAIACVLNTSFFSAFPAAAYNWTVDPPASIISGNGTDNIQVKWDAGPGIFIVKASPVDPTIFCNDSESIVFRVLATPPPDSIAGPTEICPGKTYTYIGYTSTAGVNFTWTVTGGTLSSTSSTAVDVTWDAVGPYTLSLKQTMKNAPMCMSDAIQLNVAAKVLNSFTITNAPACINTTGNYSSPETQHADATYTWAILPLGSNVGSIVGGQGTANVLVQWNDVPDSAALALTVELCGSSVTVIDSILVSAPVKPVLSSTVLCSVGTAVLTVMPAGFINYMWSTGDPSSPNITVSAGGLYTVNTIDTNGCTAAGSLSIAAQAPQVSLPYTIEICNNFPGAPASVIVSTHEDATYTYSWSMGLPSNQYFVVHNNDGVTVGTFVYTVTVTDAGGCTATTVVTVIQSNTCPTCSARPYTLEFTAVNQTPTCNTVNFTALFSGPVTLNGWIFGDPGGGGSNTVPTATHTYAKAGCYLVTLSADVLNAAGDGFCAADTVGTVCVPLAADFSYTKNCDMVSFTDLSTTFPALVSLTYLWSFGDGSPVSTAQNPVHTYSSPGSYTVTLTVSDGLGCVATVEKVVIAGGLPNAVIQAVTMPYCVGDPISFSDAGGGGVSWQWNFDDGATNGAAAPLHSYLSAGIYTVGLTVTDAEGCTKTATLLLTVNPLPADDIITYAPGLTICTGDAVTLVAPAGPGYTYSWAPTGASTQTITTGSAGTYSVTVTDAQDCTMVPDPVTVVVLPLPPAYISGNPIICNTGCTILETAVGNNYAYVWLDGNNDTIPVTGPELQICDNYPLLLLSPYTVIVTDTSTALQCSAVSNAFSVSLKQSPVFSIDISPDDCEGHPVTLSVAPPVPANVVFAWSNGATGPSITVLQSGAYIVVGTDTTSGCQGTSGAIIHPQPDLCLVPAGCYEVCNPDTICGPDGLTAYQWNRNGLALPGANNQCLIATQSGTYSLTGTNSFGCSLTSDSLVLTVIDCTCFGLNVSAQRAGSDSCCWDISYTNPLNSLFRLVIRSPDTDFNIVPGSLNPVLTTSFSGGNLIDLSNSVVGTTLPGGALNDFVTICPVNILNSPQQIIFDWYDADSLNVCSDTLEFLPLTRSDMISLCPGETVTIGGNTYTAPDMFVYTAPGANGACDTIVTYTLLLLPQPTRSETISLCPGVTVVIGGNTYTAPNVVVYTAPGPAGACDTIVTYTLLLLPQPVRSETISLCPGVSVAIGANTYTAPNVVVYTAQGANGACDTIVTYTLLLLPQPVRSETISFCPGDSVTIGGTVYTAPGTVILNIPGPAGTCDTIATYTMSYLTPAPSTVMINCPPNISIDVPAGSSSGMVVYAFPTASSDCPCPGISITLTSGQLSGVAFPLGVTNVCYMAKDSCGNTASCCFKVAVTEEMPCDVKTKGCIKYELLSITQNTAGERTYQIRVTNNCVGRMIYTAFGVPDGLIATKPDNNTVYTAPSGRQYTVSNPNTGPFNSVKFKSLSDSLANGESDVFKYTLPTQANPLFIHVMARQEPKIFSETYLNTFNCQVGTAPRPRSDTGPRLLRVFPNPTSGTLFADLSAREGEQVQVIVFDPQGRRVLEHTVMAEAIPQEIPLPEGLADGLYALEILTADGKREVVRFVVAR